MLISYLVTAKKHVSVILVRNTVIYIQPHRFFHLNFAL